jgi:hypothetical protein
MFDLSWITDTLAIGGSFPPNRTAALARDERVAAVVDLRGESCDDEQLLISHGVAFLHLPTIDFEPPSLTAVTRGLAFVAAHASAGRRVLVHCACGIGRSAVLGLCVLVEQGHAPLAALALAKDRRACVSPSPSQYEGWVAWLAAHRKERGASWRIPTFDEFTAIAYRHLVR